MLVSGLRGVNDGFVDLWYSGIFARADKGSGRDLSVRFGFISALAPARRWIMLRRIVTGRRACFVCGRVLDANLIGC